MDIKRAYHLLWVLLCLPIAREQGKVTLSITGKALLLKFTIFSHYHPYPSRRSSHFVPSRYMIFPILFFISEMWSGIRMVLASKKNVLTCFRIKHLSYSPPPDLSLQSRYWQSRPFSLFLFHLKLFSSLLCCPVLNLTVLCVPRFLRDRC